MRTLHILTACSRPDGIKNVLAELSIAALVPTHWFLIRWHIAFQSHLQQDPHGCVKDNELIALIPNDDWIWILDDDNLLHPGFFSALWKAWNDFPEKDAIVFSQNRKDALGPVLPAAPENMRVGRVDTAQVVFRKSLLGTDRMREDHKCADGILYETLDKKYPSAFAFVDEAVVNFNWQK